MFVSLLMIVFPVNIIISISLSSRNQFLPNIQLTRLWSFLQWFASSALIDHSSLIDSVSFCIHLWPKYSPHPHFSAFPTCRAECTVGSPKKVRCEYHCMLCWMCLRTASPRLLGKGIGFVYIWILLEPQRNIGMGLAVTSLRSSLYPG